MGMEVRSLAFLFLCVPVGGALAQPVPWRNTAKTAVFFEIGGNGGLGSINLDRRLNGELTLRAGYGSFGSFNFVGDGPSLHYHTATLMLNRLSDSDQVNRRFELGLGAMVGDKHIGWESGPLQVEHFAAITTVAGFRRQPPGGGFVFRMGFTPMYVVRGDYPSRGLVPSVGLSVGLAF